MSTPPPPPGPSNRVAVGGKEYSVELNDANLEASSWKNPRYDGCQTITTTLNQYNVNDVTFGKTAATQKYSRNIYFGNAVVGLNDTPEDVRLMRIENFSYIQTNRFFTVNDDNSISVQRLETTKENFDSKNGFYRSFYEDFPLGSDCRIIIADDSVKTVLQDRYNIYFNGGQLKKLFSMYLPHLGGTYTYFGGSYYIFQSGIKYGAVVRFYNENDLRKFYTGSVDDVNGDAVNLTLEQLNNSYLVPFFEYKGNSNYTGDKRMFMTFTTESARGDLEVDDPRTGNEFEAIRTIIKNNMPEGTLYNTENLAEISTSEVTNTNYYLNQLQFQINLRFPFNFTYDSSDTDPLAVYKSTLMITLCDDSVPSLLVNLPKDEHLPDGIGQKGFVIIPENIHPHIKQNLTYFLAQAGISLGTDKIPELDNTYEKLM